MEHACRPNLIVLFSMISTLIGLILSKSETSQLSLHNQILDRSLLLSWCYFTVLVAPFRIADSNAFITSLLFIFTVLLCVSYICNQSHLFILFGRCSLPIFVAILHNAYIHDRTLSFVDCYLCHSRLVLHSSNSLCTHYIL